MSSFESMEFPCRARELQRVFITRVETQVIDVKSRELGRSEVTSSELD